MKKILVINTIDYIIGGMSTVIINYLQHIDQKNYHMDFIINDNIEPIYLEIMQKCGSKTFRLQRNSRPLNYFLKLIAVIKKNRYDVVHVHGNSCTMAVDLFAARCAGCKHVIAHSHNSTCEHQKLHKLLRPLFELSCTERIACSSIAGEWLFHRKPFTVIENALDMTRYTYNEEKRTQYRNQIGVGNSAIVIGHIGFFNEQKNHRFMIELMKYITKSGKKDVHLLLVGDGELRPKMESLAKKWKLTESVTFFGNTYDVTGIMSAMDVFLFPSKWEGLGIVMLEAQLLGLPCVASSEVPEDTRITDGCTYLSLEQPAQKWCEVLIAKGSLCHADRNHEILLKNAERFDMHIQIKKLEHIYDR